MNIIPYRLAYLNTEGIDIFLDAMYELDLRYKASDLMEFWINDKEDLDRAVKRAMTVCLAAGISLKANFRSVYLANPEGIKKDWLLSSLARKLVLMNADVSNPIIARLQLKLIEHF